MRGNQKKAFLRKVPPKLFSLSSNIKNKCLVDTTKKRKKRKKERMTATLTL